MNDSELLYVLALQNLPNVGDSTAKKLIRQLGSAEAVFKEKKQYLLKIDGIGQSKIQDLHNPVHLEAAEKELEFIRREQIEVLFYKSKNYPERLKHCFDSPILLFSRGNIDLQEKRVLSIVGTRKITTQGIAFTEKLIEELAPLNPVIVSGFAYGVDITAQKAAVKNDLQTVGCLAHGLNQIYPKSHQKYVEEIERNGGFLTDFWSSDDFDRNNFLKRNRIIAGLSEATVVVESAEKGGSLVTADIANSYDREVFAVPGRTTDLQSKGCNNLIKAQKAHLLTSAADLIYLLNWELEQTKPVVQKQLFVDLNAEERVVFSFLEKGKEQLDIISLQCNLPIFKLTSILFNMEMKGVVRPLPGKQYELI